MKLYSYHGGLEHASCQRLDQARDHGVGGAECLAQAVYPALPGFLADAVEVFIVLGLRHDLVFAQALRWQERGMLSYAALAICSENGAVGAAVSMERARHTTAGAGGEWGGPGADAWGGRRAGPRVREGLHRECKA